MSIKEITVKQRVCDICGKPMDSEESYPLEHQVEAYGARLTIAVAVIMPDDKDAHQKCQAEAVAQAARELGTRKLRGRAAHKKESDNGGDETEPSPAEEPLRQRRAEETGRSEAAVDEPPGVAVMQQVYGGDPPEVYATDHTIAGGTAAMTPEERADFQRRRYGSGGEKR